MSQRTHSDPYRQAHDRVRALRGKAADHLCVSPACGQPADDWALVPIPIGDLHVVHHEGQALWFSALPQDYQPMCRAHHREQDAHLQAEFEASLDFTPDPYEGL